MAVHALKPGYHGDHKDAQENFGGAIIVYIDWDDHRWFCSAKAFPLPPDMPFGALIEGVLPEGFGQHPQFEAIDWNTVQWTLNQEAFIPDLGKTLADQGFDHKCLLRFKTPELVESYD